jgi:PleD family two-component response regulator
MNPFAFSPEPAFNAAALPTRMTEPLALIVCEQILAGSQLANRLRDLGYRVSIATNADQLVARVLAERPLVLLVDLNCGLSDVVGSITQLREHLDTCHVPILAFGRRGDRLRQAEARAAGATLVAAADGLAAQLPDLLEQILAIE